ncbi:hypothetical protein BpHYR1_036879 [Brachionus plicatilis]|uniref:Uncharacterized protein n=1 Tax=Brachionus plicatilis TaxID=10195 RepID=A0A3M7QT49_BRAPC|nr:hypothetical protein BpHYR1_036879 [Brachionus plicatilis]
MTLFNRFLTILVIAFELNRKLDLQTSNVVYLYCNIQMKTFKKNVGNFSQIIEFLGLLIKNCYIRNSD